MGISANHPWKLSRPTTSSDHTVPWSAVWPIAGLTLVAMVPSSLIVPVLKEVVAERFGAGAFWTHSFMSANLIGAICATPLIAHCCDRYTRVWVVASGLLLDALLLLGLQFAPDLRTLLLLRGLEGVAHMLALSALMACGADLSRPGSRGRVMGVVGACMMLGTAAGTRLGGLAAPHIAFVVAAIVAAGGALLTLMFLRNRAQDRAERTRWTWAVLRKHRQLLIPFAYTFIDRFCVGVIISSFVLFLADTHEMLPATRSRLLVMFLVPFALLVYPAGRVIDRIGPVFPLVIGSLSFGVLIASYGFVDVNWLPGVMLASGVVSALMFAPTLSLCATFAPQRLRGSAYAGFNAAGSLGFIAGPIVAGTICQLATTPFGTTAAYQLAFVFAGFTQILCALLTLPLLLRLWRRDVFGGARGFPASRDTRPDA